MFEHLFYPKRLFIQYIIYRTIITWNKNKLSENETANGLGVARLIPKKSIEYIFFEIIVNFFLFWVTYK